VSRVVDPGDADVSTPASTDDARLERLDVAFGRLRRIWESPVLRREFQRRIGVAVEAGAVRVLRAVQRTTASADECGVSDVAEELAVDISTASRLVDQTVGAGWLTRHTSSVDRRRSVLDVTASGAEILERATRVRAEILGELTAGWTDAEAEQLASLLERLADRLSAYDRPG
jgi:DNA-binding MarR family transcriptional regulator